MTEQEQFIKDIIDLINEPNNIFKENFENKFGNLPEDLTITMALACKEFIVESKNDLEQTLKEMFEEYKDLSDKIYLSEEEYNETKNYIKNIDSYNIVIGEILDFEKEEDFNKFSIRKQLFALENMVENLGNNLESINEIIDSQNKDISIEW